MRQTLWRGQHASEHGCCTDHQHSYPHALAHGLATPHRHHTDGCGHDGEHEQRAYQPNFRHQYKAGEHDPGDTAQRVERHDRTHVPAHLATVHG
ncbi:hypothetical protein D3C73_1168230 [compost metagenome]